VPVRLSSDHRAPSDIKYTPRLMNRSKSGTLAKAGGQIAHLTRMPWIRAPTNPDDFTPPKAHNPPARVHCTSVACQVRGVRDNQLPWRQHRRCGLAGGPACPLPRYRSCGQRTTSERTIGGPRPCIEGSSKSLNFGSVTSGQLYRGHAIRGAVPAGGQRDEPESGRRT